MLIYLTSLVSKLDLIPVLVLTLNITSCNNSFLRSIALALILTFTIFALMNNFISPANAHAYLDPNAGGFFLQVVIPIVFGAAAAFTVFWRRIIKNIKNFVNRIRGNNNNSPEA